MSLLAACVGHGGQEGAALRKDVKAEEYTRALECHESGRSALREFRLADAERHFRCALEIRERLLEPHDALVIGTRIELARTLQLACRTREAGDLLRLARSKVKLGSGAEDALFAEIDWQLSWLEEEGGNASASRQLLLDVTERCPVPEVALCLAAYERLLGFARLGFGTPLPVDRLTRSLTRTNRDPYTRQGALLWEHAFRRAAPNPTLAQQFAADHDIRTLEGTARWPELPLLPSGASCRGARTEDPAAVRRAWESTEAMYDCIEDLPVASAANPPAMLVTLLTRADGTTAAVETSGVALPVSVLECAVKAAEKLRLPSVESGYRVYYLWYRPG